MGRLLPVASYFLWTPKMSPLWAYSVTTQFIRDANGMGYIFSDIVVPPM